jgi:hypothetical protein
MAVLTRLGFFTQTITSFLEQLRNRHGGMFKSLPAGILKRYIDREGYFADAPSSESRRRLSQCAADLWRLVDRFRGHRKVSKLDRYRRLERLLKEQCVIEDEDPTDPDGDGPEGVPVRLKDPKKEKIPPTSLQGSDEDATYGHKGKGYQAQVAETCEPENPMQVVTHVSMEGAHESDPHAPPLVLDDLEQKDCKPDTLLADTGYGRGQNIVDAAERAVDLVSPSCGPKPGTNEEQVILDDFTFTRDGQQIERCPADDVPVEQGSCGEAGCRRYAHMDAERCVECHWYYRCPARYSECAGAMALMGSPAQGATSARRRREQTKAFKDEYRIRSGIEATNSEYKRAYGGGRLRVRGSPAVTRTVKFKFMALNIKRWTRPVSKVVQPARKAACQAA